MKEKDKKLLLHDLCTRIPFGVILQCCGNIGEMLRSIDSNGLINNDYDISEVKPRLFPLSSMTKEQEIEYNATFATIVYDGRKDSVITYQSFDWLNKNHFDYRSLISKGLAIDATGLNIY